MSKQTSNGTPHHLLKIIGCPLSSGSPKQYGWLRSRSRESSLPRHCATLLVWVHAAWLLSYLGSKAGGSPYIIATADFFGSAAQLSSNMYHPRYFDASRGGIRPSLATKLARPRDCGTDIESTTCIQISSAWRYDEEDQGPPAFHEGTSRAAKAGTNALKTVLQQQSCWSPDSVPRVHSGYNPRITAFSDDIAGHNSNESIPLPSNTSGVRRNRSRSLLPIVSKRGPSHSAAMSGRRRKPSVRSPSDAAVNALAQAGAQEATEPVRSEECVANPGQDSDSEDDEDRTVVVQEETDSFRSDDRERITEYYCKAVEHAGQSVLKPVLKAWIKLREPSKQSQHPYNGGSTKSDDPKNLGLYTAPPWWPSQNGWREGRGCRHREPDHIKKPERQILTPVILRLTNTYDSHDFTVFRLEEVTKEVTMTPAQRMLYRDLYRVRREEQAFEEGGRDGDALIYARRFNSHRRSRRKKPLVVRPAKERRERLEPAEQHMLAQTSASTTSTSYAPFSPATIKVERGPLPVHHTNVIQAPSPHYGVTLSREDMFDPGRSCVSDPSVEINSIFAGDNQYCHNRQSFAPIMPSPFTEASSGNHDGSMSDASLYPQVNSSLTGRTPASLADDLYRRPASVLYEPSPSYRAWPASMSQWNSIDDFGAVALPTVRLRPPRGSIGFPPNPVDIGSSTTHHHGQPGQLQALLCAQYNCSNSHSHGCRTPEAQQQLCAAHGCTLDPRTYAADTVDGNTLVPQPGIWDHKFAEYQANSAMGFDVNNAFPQ
ncbi:MAG: hypothetical protein Q9177_000760 [Variospora cf. flavescens]